MSDKSTNYDKADDYKVSAYIKIKDLHFCGYCTKAYKILGLYTHMTTFSKKYEMTDNKERHASSVKTNRPKHTTKNLTSN